MSWLMNMAAIWFGDLWEPVQLALAMLFGLAVAFAVDEGVGAVRRRRARRAATRLRESAAQMARIQSREDRRTVSQRVTGDLQHRGYPAVTKFTARATGERLDRDSEYGRTVRLSIKVPDSAA